MQSLKLWYQISDLTSWELQRCIICMIDVIPLLYHTSKDDYFDLTRAYSNTNRLLITLCYTWLIKLISVPAIITNGNNINNEELKVHLFIISRPQEKYFVLSQQLCYKILRVRKLNSDYANIISALSHHFHKPLRAANSLPWTADVYHAALCPPTCQKKVCTYWKHRLFASPYCPKLKAFHASFFFLLVFKLTSP